MKVITILSLLLLASPAFGELTKEDIRTIIKEEVRPIIKEEITASEKRTREYIDLKIEALDKSLNARIDVTNARINELDKNFDRAWILIIALIGVVTATIAIPQIIIAYRDRGQKEMQTQIEQLRERLDALQPPLS